GGGNPEKSPILDYLREPSVSRSGSGMTSMRGIVLLRNKDEPSLRASKTLSKNLNLTALPLAGEGRGEREIEGIFARFVAHDATA
ncbi:hypothetical protein, partial [Rhodocaloribacter sp.]